MYKPNTYNPNSDYNLLTGRSTVYSPEVDQPLVKIHGQNDTYAQQIAISNKNPYYTVVDRQNYLNLLVEIRKIAFTIQKPSFRVEKDLQNGLSGEMAVDALTDLSGQGRSGDLDGLKNLVIPLGITMQVPDKNKNNKFNIIPTGLVTVKNNGEHHIGMNDIIIADFPDPDTPGPKELLFTPYDANKHQFNRLNIRKCLQSNNQTNSIFESHFRDSCDILLKKLIEVLVLPLLLTFMPVQSVFTELMQFISAEL